jgi:hypothetical protein
MLSKEYLKTARTCFVLRETWPIRESQIGLGRLPRTTSGEPSKPRKQIRLMPNSEGRHGQSSLRND